MTPWTKHCSTQAAAEREAAGLRWLAAVSSGPRVASVLEVHGASLTLERITTIRPTPAHAREFGRRLAHLHAAGAPAWGSPPPGVSGHGTIGNAELATPGPDQPPTSWGPFYARYRLAPHLDKAVASGSISANQAVAINRVIDALAAGELDHPQPGALADRPARVHGDLWSGNVLWDGEGAVLIDPAAHGGHAESDLAMLALFGAPHLPIILEGYQSVSELAPGWQARVPLHQLHPLVVHAELFGPSYGSDAAEAARRTIADRTGRRE